MALTDTFLQQHPAASATVRLRDLAQTPLDTLSAVQADTLVVVRPGFDSLSPVQQSRTLYDAILNSARDVQFWFSTLAHVVETVLILAIAWGIIFAVSRAARRWMRGFEDLPNIHPGRQRAYTIGNLLVSTVRYVVWPLALITIVSEFGVNVAALIATAGFAGLAIGFGAQTLVRDVISGFFLLFDDTIHVGDTIQFNGQTGVVEHMGVRLIQMRRFDGELVMIPAGELRVFGNKSIDYARVLVEVGVSYEQDTEVAIAAVTAIAGEWVDAHRSIVLDDEAEVQAVMSLGDSAVTVRIAVRVIPGEQWQGERELRRLIKQRFDEQSIEIPFPRRTIYVRREPGAPDGSDVLQAGA